MVESQLPIFKSYLAQTNAESTESNIQNCWKITAHFKQCAGELGHANMKKEELIVFPCIRKMNPE